MTALEQAAPVAVDAELRLDVAIAVVRGDVVLDDAGRGHQVLHTVLTPGRIRLVGADGWVEALGVDELVGIVTREVRPCTAR